MRTVLLALAALLFLADVTGAWSVAEGDACRELCPEDGTGDQCGPLCAACACCAHVKPAVVTAGAARPVLSAAALSRAPNFRRRPAPDPEEIAHVPKPRLV